MFRSVRFYRLNSAWPGSEEALSASLESAGFETCGPYAEQSSGWEPPTGEADGRLCRRVDGADLLRLRTQSRLLPAAAVNEAFEERLQAYRERTGEDAGRRQRRKLKEQTRDELLPKALLKSDRTSGIVLANERLLGIDTLSEPRAERFLEYLRMALPGLDATPLAFQRPVGELLTRIFLNDPPPGFALGGECRMCDPADRKATVRCADMDLAQPSVRKHVTEGMRLTQLGIEFRGVASCAIDDKGGIAKLKLVGADVDEDLPDEDPLARLDAELALLAGTLRQLLGSMERALGGYEQGAAADERLAAIA